MGKLKGIGYEKEFWSLEEGTENYINDQLN